MKRPAGEFLAQVRSDIEAIERRTHDLFDGLSSHKLNWRANPDSWSAGQCLEHLVTANAPYFPLLDAAAAGTKPANIWERVPVLPAVWGRALLRSVSPNTQRKMKAPRIFRPGASEVSTDIVNQFYAQQSRLIAVTKALSAVDLDRTIRTSPVARFITYSVRDTLAVLVAHEQRHLNQAERVIAEHERFRTETRG